MRFAAILAVFALAIMSGTANVDSIFTEGDASADGSPAIPSTSSAKVVAEELDYSTAETVWLDPVQVDEDLARGSWILKLPDQLLPVTGLQPSTLSADGITAYEESSSGVTEVVVPFIHTYTGRLGTAERASVVTVSDDYVGGSIRYECATYKLLPSSPAEMLGAARLVYVFEDENDACDEQGVSLVPKIPDLPVAPSYLVIFLSAVHQSIDVTIDVAMDADRGYSDAWGADVFERQREMMAEVQILAYEDNGIVFNIIEQWRWTSNGPNMGNCNDNNAGTANDGVNFWNIQHWNEYHSDSQKEMLLMLTAESIADDADGCVYKVGGLRDPDDLSYLASMDGSSVDVADIYALLFSHEVGHLFSGHHSHADENDRQCTGYETTIMGGTIMRHNLGTDCIDQWFSSGEIDDDHNNLARIQDCAEGPRSASTCPESA